MLCSPCCLRPYNHRRHLPRRFKGVVEAGDRFDVKVQLGSTGESVVEMMGFEDASDAARARDILVIKHTPKSSWSLNYPESSYASEIHSIQRLETTELQKRLRLGLRIDSKSARAEKAQSRHHKRSGRRKCVCVCVCARTLSHTHIYIHVLTTHFASPSPALCWQSRRGGRRQDD